ncbi:hypothetical protein [Candidatus Nitrotoga sp. AM1P]|uniref:hypothetical protein n=1 Tax=Candidatus Nitrotoga sp. AM1P TaxID=2559597 RepID=UPI0015673865|nr:hypothetical protein [Candidatus Nitrotoga sp. AM1P]
MQDRNLQLIDLDPAGQQFAEKEFAGLNFGVEVSLTHDLGSHDRVKAASLTNGIVRVDTEHNDVARIMLKSHYFFTPEKKLMGKQWGCGPFVSLQPGSDQIIEAVGLGVMLGFKRNIKDDNDTSSWNSWYRSRYRSKCKSTRSWHCEKSTSSNRRIGDSL